MRRSRRSPTTFRAKLARAEQLAAADVIPAAELDAARVAVKQASSTLKAAAR